jgi:hypothetical protein
MKYLQKVCVCRDGYESSSARLCVEAKAYANSPCSPTSQCNNGAVCDAKTSMCTCPIGQSPDSQHYCQVDHVGIGNLYLLQIVY